VGFYPISLICKQRNLHRGLKRNLYIFRFRSYLVTDVGRILDAKGGFMNFREALWTWWAKALIKETPRDCTVVIEGVGARYECP
jgi:hypothetical protein